MDFVIRGLFYFLIGVGVYAIERWIAVKILKKDLKNYKGFVIGGHKRTKYIVATVVIIVKFWVELQVFNVKSDSKTFMYTTIEWLCVMLGLLCGSWALPRITRLIKKSGTYINEVEAGTANPLKDIKEAVIKGGKNATEAIITTEKSEEIVAEKEIPVVPITPVTPVPEEKKDNRTAGEKLSNSVDDFLKKKY